MQHLMGGDTVQHHSDRLRRVWLSPSSIVCPDPRGRRHKVRPDYTSAIIGRELPVIDRRPTSSTVSSNYEAGEPGDL